MRLPDDATLYIRIWTGQKCKACGSEFKYLRRFTAPRNQTEYNATQKSVEALYIDAARKTSEVAFPCPHCGYIQPDMIGTRKAVNHGVFTFAVFFLLLIGTMATAFSYLPGAIAGSIGALIAGLSLLFHLYQMRADPNRNQLANLAVAQTHVLKGNLVLIHAADAGSSFIIPKHTRGYLSAAGILTLAIGVFLMPVALDVPIFLCQVGGIILFIWSGSAFANAALRMKEFGTPRQVLAVDTTLSIDDSVPDDFQKKKKKA